MSVIGVKETIEKFIKTTRNDFLLIKGDWGVGKTYLWKTTVENLSRSQEIGLSHYAYVSLFGIDSLESLKNSIVTAKVDSKIIWEANNTSLGQLASNIRESFSGFEKIPILKNYTGGLIGDFAFTTIKNSIVCFDDFERKSEGFDISVVLGLASFLKEQRNCKIVFISNNEKIADTEKTLFSEHGEKLIDIELKFEPLAEEAFGYIFSASDPYYHLLKMHCLALEIKNLRTLQRIERFIEDLQPFIKDAEESVKEDIIKSLTLFVWCYYDKSPDVPSLEAVKQFSPATIYIKENYKKEKRSEEDERLSVLLNRFGYMSFTELDEPLQLLVEKGYLDTESFYQELTKKNNRAIAQKGNDSFHNAWELYNNSFSNNEDEFVKELLFQFQKNLEFIELTRADNSISILRDLGKETEAESLIDKYVEAHSETFIPIFEQTIFYSHIKDENLRKKIAEVIDNYDYKFEFGELIRRIALKNYPEYQEVKFLASHSADEYFTFFKSVNSKDLYYFVQGCLRLGEFNDTTGCSEYSRTIVANVKEALTKISSESNINKLRVSSWFNI
jgi:hypothetical protein